MICKKNTNVIFEGVVTVQETKVISVTGFFLKIKFSLYLSYEDIQKI